ncbi:MAG: hypothetical protein IKV59_02950 [Lachnospiraceae bacterium]|nr:hypothetical protein [Lachnospiraceae bacterium]
MQEIIKNILNNGLNKSEKIEQLDKLSNEIQLAKDILSGKFKYCSDCDDYYLAESFLKKQETERAKICTYEDPINSGGNEYRDGFVYITYSVCPKGHKHVINREERLK